MRHALFAAAIAAAMSFLPQSAMPTELPPALNGQECASVGDLVWSARALHKHGVQAPVARQVLADMYHGSFAPVERADAYIDAAMKFAASPFGADAPPGVVGTFVHQQCHANRGDLVPIFGVGS